MKNRTPRILHDAFNLLLLILLLVVSCWACANAFADPAPAKADPLAWPDRRPIGVIYLAGGGDKDHPGFRTKQNPRGWFPDFHRELVKTADGHAEWKPLDVADPDYARKFDAAADRFVMQSFDRAQAVPCQGVLFWDIEGEEFDLPTTYAGDPCRLPPELTRSRVKYWVWELGRRKMWAGFTFRDTQFVSTPYGARQMPSGDPTRTLIAKFQEARWTFGENVHAAYVDSNTDEDSSADGKVHPRPAAVFAEVQAKLSNWLLIPEFRGSGYDQVPRCYPLRFQITKAEPAKRGDLRPSQQPRETLMPDFENDKPTAAQFQAYGNALKVGALTFITVTSDAPPNPWVSKAAGVAK